MSATTELKLTGPSIKRGKSKQDYETDPLFIKAVIKKFGPIAWDLAANVDNHQAHNYIDAQQDSFTVDWYALAPGQWLWLNPEFDDIAPWAEKCHLEFLAGANILFLTPASVGSNWFAKHIHGVAMVYALNGRLTFVGQPTPYPKDCILSVYGQAPGFDVWRWK